MANDKKLSDLRLGASLNRLGISPRGRTSGGSGLTRLTSLKPARDLTLGSSAPKRTFVPNIPARRTIKEEATNEKPEASSPKPKHDRHRNKERGRDRGRGRGRGRGELVMSSGIFSQGPFALNRSDGWAAASSAHSSSSSSRGGGSGEARSRTSVIKEEKGAIEDSEDSQRILDLLSDSGQMDVDEDELRDGALMPITIPLANPKIMGKHLDEMSSFGKYRDVKSEPDVDFDMTDFGAKIKPTQTRSIKPQLTCSQLFSSNFVDDKLLFLQFPDALPVKSLSHESDVANQSETASTSTAPTSNLEEGQDKFSLKNVSEGYVGKLVVHKSGRVRMMLGNASLDVTMGTPCGFLQDLMAVHIDENRKDMLCLGHVDHKIVCVPDFEQLIGSAS